MNSDQISRRKHAADAHDAALARWPNRSGEGFRGALESVVRELEALSEEVPPDAGASIEWARTLRWLGDAWFDLARGTDPELLRLGDAAYRRAEQLLGGTDPLELGKLQVNWGNTLRGLAGTENRALAEVALEKYRLGRSLIAKYDPTRLAKVDDLLGSHESMLALWKLRDDMGNAPELDPATGTAADLARAQGELDHTGAQLTLEAKKLDRALHRLAQGAGVTIDSSEVTRMLTSVENGAGDPEMVTIFDALRKRFEDDVASGKIDHGRRATLARMLEELQPFASASPDDLQAIALWGTRMRELVLRMGVLLERPSHGLPMPPPESRAHAVLLHWALLRRRIAALATRSNDGAATGDRARELFAEAAQLDRELYVAGTDDVATGALERDRLRSMAAEARRFALLQNLTIATPAFPVVQAHARSSDVFFSGSMRVRATAEAACAFVGLRLQSEARGDEHGRSRWLQLREAGLALFDFTGACDAATRASVAYEFGLARTLGVPVVVVKDERSLPFDVAVVPVRLLGDAEDAARIAEALDAASYSIPPEGAVNDGIVATVHELLARFGSDQTRAGVAPVLHDLARRLDEPDPKAIEATLQAVLLQLGNPRLELIRPAWPATYPLPGRPRLFHVMPFRPSWSSTTSAAAERACGTSVAYQRHDKTDDDRIIDSLWSEICRASHVLVDITGLNENVAVELGFADALGKPTLVVAQVGSVDAGLFSTIAKRRVHEYRADDLDTLAQLVQRFLRPPAAAASTPLSSSAPAARPAAPVTTPTRPGLLAIREQFQRGLQDDAVNQRLAAILGSSPLMNVMPASAMPELVQFVRAYVSSAPELLDTTWSIAGQYGITALVTPIFDQVEHYCRHPYDVIPDHLGLAGICDDAYLVRQVLLGLRARALGVAPTHEALQQEVVMRNVVIGEPFASQLDGLIAQVLLGPPGLGAASAFVSAGAASAWSSALERARVDESVRLQLGALGIS